jgi:UDP-glucose:(heptosyl)LPS alpha-1,3-glucosyltransferase
MRVAFVKQKYVAFGGGEGYVSRIMAQCAARGYEVHLITADWQEGEAGHELQIHPVSINRRSRSSKLYSFSASVQACIGQHGFDCVFSLERTVGQDIWRAGEGVHKKWLEHRAEFEPAWKTWFNAHNAGHRAYLDMEEQCVRSTPFIICNSAMIKRYVEEVYPGLEAVVSVIHNGCDLARFTADGRDAARKQVSRDHGLDENDTLLLFPGSGWVRKGLEQAMLTLKELPEAELLVVGRDNPSKWLRMARRLGVQRRVHFVPPTKEIVRYYRAADVTLFPTWSDPFANISTESIACGTPLVTSAYNGGCEIVLEGENGAVVPNPDDINGLADGVRRLLGRRGEPNRSMRVAHSVAGCSLERNVGESLKVIERAASR